MKKILFSIGVLALTLTSCSQEDVLSVNNTNGSEPIAFRVRSSNPTRAMSYTTYNLDEFMVYGYKGCPDDAEEVSDFFENGDPVKFTREQGGVTFTSAKPYYYPVDGSWLYFAAYAPTTLNTVPFGKFGGIGLHYTVNPDITKQEDIIFANGGSNLEPDEPDQELTFQHALTKVFISEVANEDTRYKYEIAGVKFGNIDNTGDYEYRGEKAIVDDGSENGTIREDGYIQDGIGYGIFWKAAGLQTDMIKYILDEPVVLDKNTTRTGLMSGDDAADEGKGAFMLIPQQLSKNFEKEDNTISEFKEGMSYVAFLVRITYLPTGEVIYPYAKGVESISETIGEGEEAATYAWAAFPISSLWIPGSYIDYFVDFSKGAGFVAPGAAEHEYEPILGREIKFTEEVGIWSEDDQEYKDWTSGTAITVDQNNEVGVDQTEVEDPFGE